MTRSAKPSDFVQLPVSMPTTLYGFGVGLPWNEMMIRQRDVLTGTDLAAFRPQSSERRHVLGRWCRARGHEGRQRRLEKATEVAGFVDYAI